MPLIYQGVVFGPDHSGLETAYYTLLAADGSTVVQARQAVAVEAISGQPGSYGATLSFPAEFAGIVDWDTGGAEPVHAIDVVDLAVGGSTVPGGVGSGTDLIGAVVAALKADSPFLAACPGGIWDEAGPRGRSPGYAVVTEVADVPEHELGQGDDGETTSTDRQSFQVSIFAARRDTARSLGRRAAAVLGAAELLHDDGTQVACWHTGTYSAREPERGLVAQDLHQCVVTFDAIIDRST